MKNFTLALSVLIIFSFTNLLAQPCNTLTMTVERDSTESYFKLKNQIRLDDENGKLALALDAVIHEKSIAIFFIANAPELCAEKGDSIGLTFAHGRTLFLKNTLDDNCEKKFAVMVGTGGSNKVLDSLISYDIASVTVHHKGFAIKGNLNDNRQPVFRSALTCLRELATSESAVAALKEAESNSVFMVVDKQPEFAGGYSVLTTFLENNLKKQRVEGTVYVSFIVEKDGSLSEPKVLRGMSPQADAEALRVLRLMPKWTPGSHHGKIVRTRFNLPVKFK
jgi:TonB family protein